MRKLYTPMSEKEKELDTDDDLLKWAEGAVKLLKFSS